MLSRNKYPRSYVDESRAKIDSQVAAYEKVVAAAKKQATDVKRLDVASASRALPGLAELRAVADPRGLG